MVSIRRRPNGKFQASVHVGRDECGRLIRKYVTRQTFKECRKAAWELAEATKKAVK